MISKTGTKIVVALIAAAGVVAAAWIKDHNKIEPVDCSVLRSLNSNEKTAVTFDNRSGRAVSIRWVDDKGAEIEIQNGDVGPARKLILDSYVSHGFCVRDFVTGKALLAVPITSNDQNVIIPRSH